jgi:hypothetical protein
MEERDCMDASTKSGDAQERNDAADSLRRQIEDMVSGREAPESPANLRDFIARKMAERRKKPDASEPTGET